MQVKHGRGRLLPSPSLTCWCNCSATFLKQECKALNVQFHLLHGSVGEVLPGFVSERHLGAVVTDFSPLREPLKWLDDLKKKFPKDIPLMQVNSLLNCTLVLTDFCVSRCLKAKKTPTVFSFSFAGGRPQHRSLLGGVAKTRVRRQNDQREDHQTVARVPHRLPSGRETSPRG